MKNKFKVIREDQTRTSSPTFNNESKTQSPNHMHMQGGRTTEPMKKTEWTNEKHSMYLKSIEASFVNQLYDSKHMMIASLPHKGTSHDPATITSAGQFKVLRGGHWQKINFERENPQQQMMSRNNNNQCHNNLTSNPWIQHYRSPSIRRICNDAAVPSLQESITSTSRVVDLSRRKGVSSLPRQLHGSHVCQKDMLSSDTEMSDQNFVDEAVEGEKERKRNKVKRQRSLTIDAKHSDQRVPTKSFSTEDVTKNCFPAG